jgi:hypothetical protein
MFEIKEIPTPFKRLPLVLQMHVLRMAIDNTVEYSRLLRIDPEITEASLDNFLKKFTYHLVSKGIASPVNNITDGGIPWTTKMMADESISPFMALNICIGLAKAFKTSQMKYKEENPQEYVIRWETRLMAFQSEYNAQ